MLEKPDLPDDAIIACLRSDYGLEIDRIAFLPLGADVESAVYRAESSDGGGSYFVKLRRGVFDDITVAVPRLLHEQGIAPIIAPLAAQSGRLWAALGAFTLMLYPFVEGRNGFEADLSPRQWVKFGQALRAIHTVSVPPALAARLEQERYSDHWRQMVADFQAQVERDSFDDPIAAEMAAFVREKRKEISRLVRQAHRLAEVLKSRPQTFALCHADIHMGNLLIDERGDRFFIVDWDNPILAVKERDLMFIGAGIVRQTTPEEAALFYQGYGDTEIDPVALAYYRCERIVQDIAAYCEQLLPTAGNSPDRVEGLRQFTSQFLPGSVIEIAYRTE